MTDAKGGQGRLRRALQQPVVDGGDSGDSIWCSLFRCSTQPATYVPAAAVPAPLAHG